MKICTKCNIEKSLSDFWKNKHYKDGFCIYCKNCTRIKTKSYSSSYYMRNKEEVIFRTRNREEKNLGLENARHAKRRASELKATSSWADNKKVRDFYKSAKILSKQTNVKHVVDHIEPLQSKEVCGLHNEFNLRVISEMENLKKGNKRI